MRIDFDLPEPTISITEARIRLRALMPWHKQLIRDIERETAAAHKAVREKNITKYRMRQLVQYVEKAYELSGTDVQLHFDFGDKP